MFDLDQVKAMADDQGWGILDERQDENRVRLVRDNIRMDVWAGRRGATVAIIERHHPTRYCRFVTEAQLDKLLSNPTPICRQSTP